MSTPFPRPKSTDISWNTDVYIKNLALAVDAAIGSTYKVSMLPLGYSAAMSAADSRAWITFPNLGTVTGALVWVKQGAAGVGGARTEYPPVPPASIGWTIVNTFPYVTVVQCGSGGAVLIEGQTNSTNRGQNNGVTMQWGAQKVASGPTIPLVGIAWGPV